MIYYKKIKELRDKVLITQEKLASILRCYPVKVNIWANNKFDYDETNCVSLAKEIYNLLDDKSNYSDYISRKDTKNQLSLDLVIMLRKNGYPPQWDDKIFSIIITQVNNQKRSL